MPRPGSRLTPFSPPPQVDEPSSPTFVVVYDLQSGTLFKKCKLGVNVVSMAISSQSSCIVVGLEDCMVVVIDLISGRETCSLLARCVTCAVTRGVADGGGGRVAGVRTLHF